MSRRNRDDSEDAAISRSGAVVSMAATRPRESAPCA